MLKREEILGMSNDDNTRGLVYPILFSDGKHFPKMAKDTYYKDISRWGFSQKGFEDTDEYINFQRQVEDIAKTKMPDLNAKDLEGAKKIILGTARSMGLEVKS